MPTTKIGKFISEHDNWEELLASDPFNIKIKRDGDFVILSYNQLKSDFNNPIVQEARGIIFRENEWEVPVCHAMDKFGNYGESYVPEMDFDDCFVTEKIDGSLIKVWYDFVDKRWRISTNGTINAFDAKYSDLPDRNFGKLFVDTAKEITGFETLDEFMQTCTNNKNVTYYFELVSPETRVVIPYDEPDIYYLGCRQNETNEEVPFYECTWKFLAYGIKVPKIYPLNTIERIMEAAAKLPWDNEGYVVCDKYLNRCKIKSPSYILAHHGRNNNNLSKKSLIDIVIKGMDDDFLIYADDYTQDILNIKKELKDFKDACSIAITDVSAMKFSTKKELAEYLKDNYKAAIKDIVFLSQKNGIKDVDELTKNWTASKWKRILEN